MHIRHRLVGRDDNDYIFEVHSASREGVVHEVHVSRRYPHEMWCSCEDCTYRRRKATVERSLSGCRHERIVAILIKKLMAAMGNKEER